MSEATPTATATPTPGAPEPTTPTATNPNPTPAANAGEQPPWGSAENFDAEKAWKLIQNLRNEKADPALKQQVDALTAAQEQQRAKFAEALGLTEPPKNEDDLAETVRSIQERLNASEREATKLRIAAEKNIPAEYHDLLTETDTEKLQAQAEKVGALVAANAAASQTPQFQPNPGQGQGGAPLSDEAKAAAEYAKFYPDSTSGK